MCWTTSRFTTDVFTKYGTHVLDGETDHAWMDDTVCAREFRGSALGSPACTIVRGRLTQALAPMARAVLFLTLATSSCRVLTHAFLLFRMAFSVRRERSRKSISITGGFRSNSSPPSLGHGSTIAHVMCFSPLGSRRLQGSITRGYWYLYAAWDGAYEKL